MPQADLCACTTKRSSPGERRARHYGKQKQTLYTLTHLRARLHITLRDLRSALAYMLAGTRDCDQIHQLYQQGNREQIIQGFYFNSWMGGDHPTADRLLTLLQEMDVGLMADPRLDRALGFISPAVDRSLFALPNRGDYDQQLLRSLFAELPREASGQPSRQQVDRHQRYVAMTRRRTFFERRDSGWQQMLPYRAAQPLLQLIQDASDPAADLRKALSQTLTDILHAINRGEGLSDPDRLGGKLALQVREVERGTIRSYRVFPTERFSLHIAGAGQSSEGDKQESSTGRFVEQMPSGLILRYQGEATTNNPGITAELPINLDVYEMLHRLNNGYCPSVEEEQGYYLSLTVFKNLLSAEPYQEVLLTTTGHDFYQIERHGDGVLEMTELGVEDG